MVADEPKPMGAPDPRESLLLALKAAEAQTADTRRAAASVPTFPLNPDERKGEA